MDLNPHQTVVRLSVHNSSWRPPGRPGALGRFKSDKNKSSLLQQKLNKCYRNKFFSNFTKMLFFSSLLSTATAQLDLDMGSGLSDSRVQERSNLEFKKIRWARSTTEAPDLLFSADGSAEHTERVLFSPERTRVQDRAGQDVVRAAENPDQFPKASFLVPFGLRLVASDERTLRKFEALEEIIKPSNIRKRNFSASISSVTSETSIGNKTKDMSNNDLDESVTKDNEDLSPEDSVIADLSRGSKIRLISTATPKQSEDRSRIWIKRTTAVPPQRSSSVEKRGRVRLRSHLGNTPKVTTHLPNRKEEEKSGLNDGEGEERGAKRDRMRSFKIRRPNNTTSDIVTPEDGIDTPVSDLEDGGVTSSPDDGRDMNQNNTHNAAIQETTSTMTSSTSTRPSTTSQASSTSFSSTSTASTEFSTEKSTTEIIQLSGLMKDYKDIVRGVQPTTTTIKSTTDKIDETTSTTTTTATTTTTSRENETTTKATPSTTFKSTSPKLTTTTLSTTTKNNTVEETTTTTTTTRTATTTTTTTTTETSQPESTSRITEPLRPREDLNKDLLEAIRRKINKNKAENQKSEQGLETKEVSRNDSAAILNQSQKPVLEESKPEPTRIAGKYVTHEQRVEQERKQEKIAEQEQKQEKDAEQERLERVRAARIALLNSGISPSFNSVSSTRSPPFKPIFQDRVEDVRSGEDTGRPVNRLNIFLAGTKPGPGVKIPDVSYIQDKLARLNAAISEGLKLKRQEEDDERKMAEEEKKENQEMIINIDGIMRDEDSHAEKTTPKPNPNQTITKTAQPPTLENPPNEAEKNAAKAEKTAQEHSTKPQRSTTPPPRSTTHSSTTTTMSTSTMLYKDIGTTEPNLDKTQIYTSNTYRTRNRTEFIQMPMSNIEPKETRLFDDLTQPTQLRNVTSLDETMADKDVKNKEVIDDITDTTIYVVAVIAIIPIAGLFAWFARATLRRKGLSGSEASSETGLNRPITEDDSLNIGGRSYPSLPPHYPSLPPAYPSMPPAYPSHNFETILEAPENIQKRESDDGGIWEFPRANLRLQTILGEGNFGKVWKAEADDICGLKGTRFVAVKTVKEGCGGKDVDDLLQEMNIMKDIGPHPNIVSILGVSTLQEPFLLIMEYVMYGKLLTHLREQRAKQSSFFTFSKETNDMTESLTAKDLTKFAYGVAKGMEFIISKGIIHRDLAARNILVDQSKNCKISDFGLSRNLKDLGGEMYEQKSKGALPIRWMAPESLYFSVFTPKSDVWGFGILMWEIVTLGSTPYPGMGAREVMRRVRDGYRLERPAHCHPQLYHIIQTCWSGDMNKRPDFSELRKDLAKLLEDQHGYIDLQNISDTKYYSMDQNPDEEEKL